MNSSINLPDRDGQTRAGQLATSRLMRRSGRSRRLSSCSALLLASVSLAFGAGCSDSSLMIVADAGVLDSSAFVPDATYSGEGVRCELSIDCGSGLVCVDDECIRSERLAEMRLGFGTPREITTDRITSLAGVPAFPPSDATYERWTLGTALVPAAAGTRLALFPRHVGITHSLQLGPDDLECTLVLVASDVVGRHFPRRTCEAVGGAGATDLVVAGRHLDGSRDLYVHVLAHDLAVQHDIRIGANLAASIGPDATLHQVSAVVVHEGLVYVGIRLGTAFETGSSEFSPYPTQRERFAIARIALDTGEPALVSPPGASSAALAGDRPWLVVDDSGVSVVFTMATSEDGTSTRLRSFHLSDWTQREIALDAPAHLARVFQPSYDDWYLTLAHHPICTSFVLASRTGEMFSYPMRRCEVDPDPMGPDVTLSRTSWFFGSGATSAPVLAHADTDVLVDPSLRDGVPVVDTTGSELARLVEPLGSPLDRGLGAIRRYGATLEVAVGPISITAPSYRWIELPLRRLD